MSPTSHVSYATGTIFGSAGRVFVLRAGRSGSPDVASFWGTAPSGASTGELALRFAAPSLLGEGWVCRGGSCVRGAVAESWGGWVGMTGCFAGLV